MNVIPTNSPQNKIPLSEYSPCCWLLCLLPHIWFSRILHCWMLRFCSIIFHVLRKDVLCYYGNTTYYICRLSFLYMVQDGICYWGHFLLILWSQENYLEICISLIGNFFLHIACLCLNSFSLSTFLYIYYTHWHPIIDWYCSH